MKECVREGGEREKQRDREKKSGREREREIERKRVGERDYYLLSGSPGNQLVNLN